MSATINPPSVITHVTTRPDGRYDVVVSMRDGDEYLYGLTEDRKDNLLRAIDILTINHQPTIQS